AQTANGRQGVQVERSGSRPVIRGRRERRLIRAKTAAGGCHLHTGASRMQGHPTSQSSVRTHPRARWGGEHAAPEGRQAHTLSLRAIACDWESHITLDGSGRTCASASLSPGTFCPVNSGTAATSEVKFRTVFAQPVALLAVARTFLGHDCPEAG